METEFHRHTQTVRSGGGGGGAGAGSHQHSIEAYADSLFLVSLGVIILSFAVWRNSIFLPQWLRDLIGLNGGATPHHARGTASSSEESSQSVNNNNNNSGGGTASASTEEFQVNEPFQDVSLENAANRMTIKIIYKENVYTRHFNPSTIQTISQLKRYFYPAEYNSGKRILFLFNGRPMIDSSSVSVYFNSSNNTSSNGVSTTVFERAPICIHCIIKNPLEQDQVTNDPNFMRTSNYQSNYYNTPAFTWMCTRTLYVLSGISLVLLWCLQFLKPKIFDFFSSVLLIIFTLCWGLGFYSSLKFSNNINNQPPQQQPQPQQTQ